MMTENGNRYHMGDGWELRNPDLAELVFVLDRSGSMSGMERSVVDGFNRLLEDQRRLPGRALVSVELFNERFEVVYDREDIVRVEPMSPACYRVGGCTALLDAVGRAIRHIARRQWATRPEDRPGHTLFVINTDGLENASREYTRADIRGLVHEQERYGWEFMFLGANIDSYAEAGHLGIRPHLTCNVVADERGMEAQYRSVAEAVSSLRSSGSVGHAWRRLVDADFGLRGKR